MVSLGSFFSRVSFALAVISIGLGTQPARAQLGVGDIVLGRSEASDSFRVYDKSSNTWGPGPGWSFNFIQSIEFDNSGGLSHNARGNMIGANFGNANTGFELYNFATDGSAGSESVWSIVEATGGTKGTAPDGAWLSQRGGGVSLSPGNNYLAWTNYETGEIYVHDYVAGATVGTGAGASVSGARRTGLGNGTGGAGTLTALRPLSTSGTAWLNDTTVVAFSGFGELITVDVSGIAGGSEDGTLAGYLPTEMTNWKIANNEVSFTAQNTDVEYNALVDPNHIYAAVTTSGFETKLFAYNYNPVTGAISLNTTLDVPNTPSPANVREPREIALDADGNLFFSGYAGSSSDNIIMKLADATNIASWNEANVTVFYNSPDYTSFNGMDVAFSEPVVEALLGDYNENDILDAADYTVWRDAFEVGGTIPNDPTGGVATQEDYDFWKANFGDMLGPGAGAVDAVPEPTAIGLLSVALAIAAGARRRGASA